MNDNILWNDIDNKIYFEGTRWYFERPIIYLGKDNLEETIEEKEIKGIILSRRKSNISREGDYISRERHLEEIK